MKIMCLNVHIYDFQKRRGGVEKATGESAFLCQHSVLPE